MVRNYKFQIVEIGTGKEIRDVERGEEGIPNNCQLLYKNQILSSPFEIGHDFKIFWPCPMKINDSK